MDHQALKTEIDNDPEGIGYVGKSNSEIVDLLNGSQYTQVLPITVSGLTIWAVGTQEIVDIYDGAQPTNTNKAIRAICMGAMHLFGKSNDEEIDLTDPDVANMIDGLVAAGIVEQANKDALIAMATAPAGRSEILFGQKVNINDVRTAMSL